MADRLELAAVALDRTRMPIVVTNPRQPDNPIVLANQAFLDLTGYTANEVVGRNCRFLQGEGTSAETIAEIRACLSEVREFTLEVLNYRKDGAPFWNMLHVSPVHGDDGELLYFFASQDDVTEFRKVQSLEATEHRLLKEVDHRARNVLAVVNGIVRLSNADDAARYAAAIQQRVQALARAHSLLADQGWREVALEQILVQQLEATGSDRIAMEGPSVMVAALAVQPLALVLHELFLNAVAHGSLSGQTGRLDVHWVRGQAGSFELTWEERGDRSPPREGRPGFGTAIVRSMIEKQLQGEVSQNWTEDGLTVKISVPGDLAQLSGPAAK